MGQKVPNMPKRAKRRYLRISLQGYSGLLGNFDYKWLDLRVPSSQLIELKNFFACTKTLFPVERGQKWDFWKKAGKMNSRGRIAKMIAISHQGYR